MDNVNLSCGSDGKVNFIKMPTPSDSADTWAKWLQDNGANYGTNSTPTDKVRC